MKFINNEKKKFLTVAMEKFLSSQDILQKWAPFSLRHRCRMFKFLFNQKISPKTLRKFYIDRGIRYTNVSYIKKSKLKDPENLKRK